MAACVFSAMSIRSKDILSLCFLDCNDCISFFLKKIKKKKHYRNNISQKNIHLHDFSRVNARLFGTVRIP